MEKKHLSDVINHKEHIEPYRMIQIVSGLGSGKSTWVEDVLMQSYNVLLITSRKSKVKETCNRTGLKSCLNLTYLEDYAFDSRWENFRDACSCVCNNWQIEYYVQNHYMTDIYRQPWDFFDIIVVDEVHSLITDAVYCDAPFYMYEFINAAYKSNKCKIILMTATPDPLTGLFDMATKKDFKEFDFRDICINLQPEELCYKPKEVVLEDIVSKYRTYKNLKWHVVYFATRTDNIKNKILPFLIEHGIPEENIAVSFTNKDATEGFSQTILDNKERTELYLQEKEDIPNDIKIFITTSKNKEGININNDEYEWDVIIESHWKVEMEQMWGRIRSGLDKVVIVYDAKQHQTHKCDRDFDFIFAKKILRQVNNSFDEWCTANNLPLTSRFKNEKTKDKIKQIHKERFPYLRYSAIEDMFCIYKGRTLGRQDFDNSINHFKRYINFRLGKLHTTVDTIFPIPSYIYIPPAKEGIFYEYIKGKGYLDGTLLSKEAQQELLNFISDDLHIRQKGNSKKKYASLNAALKSFGYKAKEYTKHKENKFYGYYKLEKITTGEEFDVAI